MGVNLEEHTIFMLLVLSSAFYIASCIRVLKDGPMMGPDGRQYKLASLRNDGDDIPFGKGVGLPSDAYTVRVQCTEATMIILIKADLYNNGRFASPDELFLGHARSEICQAIAVSDTEFVIETGLHDCGSKLIMDGDSMVYSNELVFLPVANYQGITRMNSAVIPVACHYRRMHNVSSSLVQPTLTPSTSVYYAMEQSDFSLRLMTDDWKSKRSSNQYFLGDILHLEASFNDAGHVPRRLFIASCVATLEPDVTSVPRYYFIENHGCLTDSKDEGSNARFLSRTKAHILQLQLSAFLFHQDPRNSIYITCHLRADGRWHSSLVSKACNYINARWNNVDGSDGVCRCCDNTCSSSHAEWLRKADQSKGIISKDTAVRGSVTLGPVIVFQRK